MKNELDAVSEVREWRRQVMESWKGKTWEEIEKQLDESCERFEKKRKEERSRKEEGAA